MYNFNQVGYNTHERKSLMIKKIKSYLLYTVIPVIALLTPVAAPSIVRAQPDIPSAACTGTKLQITDPVAGSCTDTKSTSDFNSIITKVVNIFTVVVGIVAVIMIIVGGFRYITSGGESNAVSGAKKTILFAIIGLIIVVLAQVIVRFVLNTTASGIS